LFLINIFNKGDFIPGGTAKTGKMHQNVIKNVGENIGGGVMKKIFVLLLMFALFYAVSCDGDGRGVDGSVISLQDLDSVQIYPADSTEAKSVLSRSNSGWSAYRWTTSATEGMPATADDPKDCDGAYKVSYFERVANVPRFVGGGMCLDSVNNNIDTRVVNLRYF